MESIENHTAKTTDPIYVKMMDSQIGKIPNHYSIELYQMIVMCLKSDPSKRAGVSKLLSNAVLY
jgi:hypothetical protein